MAVSAIAPLSLVVNIRANTSSHAGRKRSPPNRSARRHELRDVEVPAGVVARDPRPGAVAPAGDRLVELGRQARVREADVLEQALGVGAQRVAELAQLIAELRALD